MIWLGLNFKRYTPDEEKQLDILDNLSYKRDNKPFYIKDFDLNIYDLENIQNKKPQLAIDDNQNIMNNANVHKFITGNSLISGTIYMQVVMSKQSFNLNTKLSRNLYVKSNKNSMNSNNHVFDDSEFEMMMGKTPSNEVKSENIKNEEKKEINADDEDVEIEYVSESEDEDNLDKKLNGLEFK